MKKILLTIAVPSAIAAGLLVGCGGPRITARTYPGRPSIVQVSEGYDTVGRRWEDQSAKPGMERIYQGEVPASSSHAARYSEYPPSSQSKMVTRSESQLRTYTGTITDIDYAGRELTLKDAMGDEETFLVSNDVQRFNEAKVGDKVELIYYIGYNAEVRKPTAEEQQNPLVILGATGRAGAGESPSGASTRQIRAVVTIEALNRANQTLTVKGPRGNYYVARVADPSRFDDVHIGDTIVMTFKEALAVSLERAN